METNCPGGLRIAMSKTDRREFIKCGALAGAAVAAGSVLGTRAARAQDKDNNATIDWIADLGKVKDLNEKDPVLVKAQFKDEEGTIVAEEKVFVRWEQINRSTGRWVVLSAICQHLKCKVEFFPDQDKFVCPCHGSEYDVDGEVLKRPTRRSLPDYSDLVEEEDGRLKLRREPEQ